MASQICKFEYRGNTLWGLVTGDAVRKVKANSLSDFFSESWKKKIERERVPLSKIKILSPIEYPSQIVCQGENYSGHIKETGKDPREKKENLFFMKATSTVSPAIGEIKIPDGVELLDYEAELALVVRKKIQSPVKISENMLHEYIAGVTLANDISARDIQIPKGQWFQGKSYRGFCPIGPFISLLDKNDFQSIERIQLKLEVNGELRQKAFAGDMIFKPAETLTELSKFMDLYPGDLILTGTPAGVALQVPKKIIRGFALAFFSEQKQKNLFIESQKKILHYLKYGDRIQASAISEDGKINSGIMDLMIT